MAIKPVQANQSPKIFSELLAERGQKGVYAFSGNNETAGTHFQSPVRTDFFSVVLVEKGYFHVQLNLKDYYLKKNQLSLAAPSALKQVISLSSDCVYTGIIFTPEYLTRIGMHKQRIEALNFFTSEHPPVLDLTVTEARIMRSLLYQIAENCQPERVHPFRKEVLQYSFLTFLYEMAGIAKRYPATSGPRLSRKEELTINFAMLVTRHFREKRKVHEYAAMMYISPKYLSSAVKDFTGKSAGELIDDLITQEAKYLLFNPGLNIGEITENLNFPDQSQFGKFFKKQTGMSPKEFRKNIFK